MTIDEKLSHFYDITVEEAHAKAAAILEEHRETLEKMTEERKALSEENAQAQIKAETANARREINKALSAEQLTIKRDWTKKQNELKEKIFSEVKGLLESYTKTPEYEDYLTDRIKEALDFAEKDELSIYLSPEDSSLAEKLQQKTGDLSENAEYDAAKDEQRDMEARIEEIEKILKNAVVIDEKFEKGVISLGCHVLLEDITLGKEVTYHIVGSTEANSLEGKISNESPVGKALMGAHTGDVVDVELPSGIMKYKVLEIQRNI